MTEICNVALKEWATTCHALGQGCQIVLLRKGGILDPDGAFELEHEWFWLQPTYEHQHLNLVKAEYCSLFDAVESQKRPGENTKSIVLRWLAHVEKVWSLTPENAEILSRLPHMWSEEYLQIRWNFRPEQPLLCAALRIYNLVEPYVIPMRPELGGCRSWIELPEPLETGNAAPALGDAEFAAKIDDVEAVMESGTSTAERQDHIC